MVCECFLADMNLMAASSFFFLKILALVAVRKAMDYMFSQHDLSFLDDVIPEKDKKKKEDEKKKRSSIGSDVEDVRLSAFIHPFWLCSSHQSPPALLSTSSSVCSSMIHLKIPLPANRYYLVKLFYPSILALGTSEILTPIPFESTNVRGERFLHYCS